MSETNTTTTPADTSAPAEAENTETAENTEEIDAAEGSEEATDEAAEETIEAKDEKADKAAKEQKKEEKKSNKKKFKIKVDKAEEDVEIDLDNEEEIRKQLQLARAAQKRMSEMAELKKDVTDLINRLNSDPFSVLGDPEGGLGLNVDDLVRQYVEKKLADAEKSPEQLEKERLAAELKAIKEEREREKANREKEQREIQLQNEIIRYDNMMTKALENSEFKKPSPYLIKKMSDYMILGVQNKIDVSPEDVLPLVREDIQNEIKELINSAPEEVIEAMFGKEIFNKMRKKHVAKAKQAPPVHASSVKDAGSKTEEKKDKPKMSYKDFFK